MDTPPSEWWKVHVLSAICTDAFPCCNWAHRTNGACWCMSAARSRTREPDRSQRMSMESAGHTPTCTDPPVYPAIPSKFGGACPARDMHRDRRVARHAEGREQVKGVYTIFGQDFGQVIRSLTHVSRHARIICSQQHSIRHSGRAMQTFDA
jgi:hypothetical protein